MDDPVAVALVGVVVGWLLGFATAEWQRASARNQAAAARVTEAIAPVQNLLWDDALIGGVETHDLAPSRVAEQELASSSVRRHAIRPQLTAVSIGDPDAEIRRDAGELGRAVSLFTRSPDGADLSKAVSLDGLLKSNDRCWDLLLKLEERNLTRVKGAEPTAGAVPILNRPKGDRINSDDRESSAG